MPHDPFDRLERAAEAVVRRAEDERARIAYEQGNRLGLLWVHALVALLAGVQMALWGTATQIEALAGPYARYIMGPLAVAGGAMLAVGLLRRPRSIRMEGMGLALVALWDFLMVLGLGIARIQQNSYRILGIGEPLPTGYVSAYPTSVYGGLLALLLIHLWTLRRLRQRERGLLDGESLGG